jgi:histidine triad (HIT) family protein
MNDCLFCKIVKGESPSHTVWEDDSHIAFLSIFPNTDGVTILVTKEHYPSYVADAPIEVQQKLMLACTDVCKLLDEKLEGVGRTGIVIEGMGVNHLHAKLFPMHDTEFVKTEWRQFPKPDIDTFFTKYEGYLSSHSSHARAEDSVLAELAKKIRD